MTRRSEIRRNGKIVTFYSYKGGTGRTMALVNVGWILASNGLRVLLVDWDLEAPGLHRYLRPLLIDPELSSTDGLINMVQTYAREVLTSGAGENRTAGSTRGTTLIENEQWLRSCARLDPYTTGLDVNLPSGGRLDFIPAGRQSVSYSAAVTTFNWQAFYERLGGGSFLQVLREEMRAAYDYVLIDSRTGVSDVSGVCTILMPDILVDGFVLNRQSIRGSAEVAASIVRTAQPPIRILPVPMRVEDAEQELLEQGRDAARVEFAPFLTWLDEQQHDRYWGEVEIPYKPFYAYAEIPATVKDRPLQEGTLLGAFERLTAWLTDDRVRSLVPQSAEERRRLTAAYLRDPSTVLRQLHVSYAPTDRMWAEWAAACLKTAGYRVSLHSAAEPRDGRLPEVTSVLERRGRLLALLSPEYLLQPRAGDIGAQVGSPHTAGGPALVTVRVQDLDGALLGAFGDRDSTDLSRCASEEEAVLQLITAVGPPLTSRREDGDTTAATVTPPFPGASPAVHRVPLRNVSFTGRGALLEELRDRLTTGSTPAPQALCGLGGMGKTQVAQEYAHRFKAAYDVVWWVTATQPGRIRPALAQLAPRLGLEAGKDEDGTVDAVLRALRRGDPYDRWLLIYDDAERPADLAELIPTGPPGGHVLLTTKDRTWAGSATLLDVGVFRRRESTQMLHRLDSGLSEPDAERVAEELGDLPLAVGQAAVWLRDSGMPVTTYLSQLESDLAKVLRTTPLPRRDYPRSAADTWRLAVDGLRRVDPAAAEMLEICAFFGPAPIPMRLLYSRAVGQALTLPEGESPDEMVIAQVMRAVNRFGLAGRDPGNETLTVHRLVQAVVRDQVDDGRATRLRAVVHDALVTAVPGDPDDPADWDRYAELLPHLKPSGAADSTDLEVRRWVTDSVRCLRKRSLHGAARDLAEWVLGRWQERGIGAPDDPQTLMLRAQLGHVLRSQGRLREAYEIDLDAYERFRRSRGPNYAHTLVAAGNLGADLRALGRYQEAFERDQQTLETARYVLGDDHARTLTYADNAAVSAYLAGDRRAALELQERVHRQQCETHGPQSHHALSCATHYARALYGTGNLQQAVELLENTVELYRQTLGDAHSDTLRARRTLAVALRRSGVCARAKEIDEDIHSRYVEAYGPEHPDTLAAACGLAGDVASLGDIERAQQMAERALTRYDSRLGPGHPATLACAANLSVYRRLAGRREEAWELSNRALEQLTRALGETHPHSLGCLINRANDLALAGASGADKGGSEAAAGQERQGRNALLEVLGPDHYDTIAVTSNLALSLRATGHTEEAEQLTQEALRRARDTLGEGHPTTRAVRAGQRLDADLEPPIV